MTQITRGKGQGLMYIIRSYIIIGVLQLDVKYQWLMPCYPCLGGRLFPMKMKMFQF